MSTKQIGKPTTEIQIPNDVKVSLKGSMLQVQGPLGKVYKNMTCIYVDVVFEKSQLH